MLNGPVIDADHQPPFIPSSQSGRQRPSPLQPPLLEAPPLYSSHTTGGPDHYPVNYDLPPPYTPDGCDTSELLPHSQLLSMDTPPAYQTIDPQLYTFPIVPAAEIAPVHSQAHSDTDTPVDTLDSDTLRSEPAVVICNPNYGSTGCQVGSSIGQVDDVQEESSDMLESNINALDEESHMTGENNRDISLQNCSSAHRNEPVSENDSNEVRSIHFFRRRNPQQKKVTPNCIN